MEKYHGQGQADGVGWRVTSMLLEAWSCQAASGMWAGALSWWKTQMCLLFVLSNLGTNFAAMCLVQLIQQNALTLLHDSPATSQTPWIVRLWSARMAWNLFHVFWCCACWRSFRTITILSWYWFLLETPVPGNMFCFGTWLCHQRLPEATGEFLQLSCWSWSRTCCRFFVLWDPPLLNL